jgi:RNA polymerase sigma-70 factor, ECF subfamily
MIGITELSYEEAAQVCNIAVGTVKSRLNRARAKLAEHLGLSGVHEIDYDPTVTGLAARKSTKAL